MKESTILILIGVLLSLLNGIFGGSPEGAAAATVVLSIGLSKHLAKP